MRTLCLRQSVRRSSRKQSLRIAKPGAPALFRAPPWAVETAGSAPYLRWLTKTKSTLLGAFCFYNPFIRLNLPQAKRSSEQPQMKFAVCGAGVRSSAGHRRGRSARRGNGLYLRWLKMHIVFQLLPSHKGRHFY